MLDSWTPPISLALLPPVLTAFQRSLLAIPQNRVSTKLIHQNAAQDKNLSPLFPFFPLVQFSPSPHPMVLLPTHFFFTFLNYYELPRSLLLMLARCWLRAGHRLCVGFWIACDVSANMYSDGFDATVRCHNFLPLRIELNLAMGKSFH